jgi:hypothetical protein
VSRYTREGVGVESGLKGGEVEQAGGKDIIADVEFVSFKLRTSMSRAHKKTIDFIKNVGVLLRSIPFTK